MKNKLKCKTIKIEIYLSINTEQYFEVPMDYEIKGSTPQKAYQNLIEDFEGQNPNAMFLPGCVELGEYGCDFNSLGDEFTVYDNITNEESTIFFDGND